MPPADRASHATSPVSIDEAQHQPSISTPRRINVRAVPRAGTRKPESPLFLLSRHPTVSFPAHRGPRGSDFRRRPSRARNVSMRARSFDATTRSDDPRTYALIERARV